MNKRHSVLLAFGSNLGDRVKNIEHALGLLNETDTVELVKTSSYYKTEPMGEFSQPDFINSAALIFTTLNAKALLKLLKNIELLVGRRPRARWREREIDIDILLFDDVVMDDEELQIPHRQMHKRNFVLTPAVEIAPDFLHPVLNKSIYELKLQCSDTLNVVKM